MNQEQNILKEKGIFLYQEKGEFNRAGNYFLEWLNNAEDSNITDQIVSCFTDIFLEEVNTKELLSYENKLICKANFSELYKKLRGVSDHIQKYNQEIKYVMIPWSYKSGQHHLNVRIWFEYIINDQEDLFREDIGHGLLECCIQDFIKKINPTNKCLSIKDFTTNPILIETITEVLIGNLVQESFYSNKKKKKKKKKKRK